MLVVDQGDIDRTPRLGRLRRQLGQAAIASGTTAPQHQFLDPEVTRIHGVLLRVPLQAHQQRHPQREPETLPGIRRQPTPVAPLRAADRHATEPGPLGQLRLGEAPSQARGTDDATEVHQLLEVAPLGLQGKVGAFASRDMIVSCSRHALRPRLRGRDRSLWGPVIVSCA